MSVHQISRHLSFVDELAKGLLVRFDSDILSQARILLPGRRACRMLKQSLIKHSDSTLLLPQIEAIGDYDMDEEIVSQRQRQIILADIIAKFKNFPYSSCLVFADEIANIIDEFRRENIPFSKLNILKNFEFAEHQKVNIEFLQFCINGWLFFLKRNNLVDIWEHKAKHILKDLEKLKQKSEYPIIIAGSTGTIKLVRNLIESVAQNENGFVVLNEAQDIFPQIELPFWLENCGGRRSATPTQAQYLELEDEQEEARTIAVIIRDYLEQDKEIGVISNNQLLLQRVQRLLEIWQIEAENSVGTAIFTLPQTQFFMAILEYAENPDDFVLFLNLVKNKFFAFGESDETIAEIEINHRKNIRGFSSNLKSRIDKIFKHFDCTLKTHIEILNELSQNLSDQYFQSFLEDLKFDLENQKIKKENYAEILKNFIRSHKYYPSMNIDQKVHLLTPIEARLKQYDVMILADLNENSWPKSEKDQNILTRSMSEALEINNHDKMLNLASHDFNNYLASAEVILLRAKKSLGALQIKSRFLNNLEHTKIKHPWDLWAKKLFLGGEIKEKIEDYPNPPMDSRPKKLFVTDIEKLSKNPYWLYARKILNLKEVPPIFVESEAKDFGVVVHKIIDKFIGLKKQDLESLLNIADQIFEKEFENSHMREFLQIRFETIAEIFIEIHKERLNKKISSEARIESNFYKDFILAAKSDRLEEDESGVNIIDYKTGYTPTKSEVVKGNALQLLCEAVILMEEGSKINGLEYWELKPNSKEMVRKIMDEGGQDLMLQAKEYIVELVEHFIYNQTSFLPTPDKSREVAFNEYDHLERSSD